MGEDDKICFVIMPFGKKGTSDRTIYENNYKIIKTTVKKCGYETYRVDELDKPGSITKKIVSNLYKSDLVIADLSDANPNVLYELGIRHALKRNGTILIFQNDDEEEKDILFDIADYRILFYSTRYDGPKNFRNELTKSIENCKYPNNGEADNPVHDFLKEDIFIIPSEMHNETKKKINTLENENKRYQNEIDFLRNENKYLKKAFEDIFSETNKILIKNESLAGELSELKILLSTVNEKVPPKMRRSSKIALTILIIFVILASVTSLLLSILKTAGRIP